MGSFKTRIIIFVCWLLAIPTMFVCFNLDWGFLGAILAVFVFGAGMGMGIILFGDPLPPSKGSICRRCKSAPAVVSEHYWTTSHTIPAGSVKLCEECADGFAGRGDHNRDWGKR
jgi:hypothetical protein